MDKIVYLIKVVDLVIEISFDREILLFDSWNQFVNDYLEAFLVSKQKIDISILVDGPTRKTHKKLFSPAPSFKHIIGNKYRFSNLLSPSLFLHFILDIVMRYQSKKGFIFLHGSGCIDPRGRCYLFIGKSGVGKSTCLKKMSLSTKAIGEDSIPSKIIGSRIYVYPFPANIKLQIKSIVNKPYVVTKIFSPRKSLELRMEKSTHIAQTIELVDAVVKSKSIKSTFIKISKLRNISYTLSHSLAHRIDNLILN